MKEIVLGGNKSKKLGLVALVDDGDYDDLIGYSWHCKKPTNNNHYYAERCYSIWINGSRFTRCVLMHRQILGLIDPMVKIDHHDHNSLNNQRSNLIITTTRGNCCNKIGQTSPGVCWDKERGKWRSHIKIKDKQKFLGRFETEIEAHQAYLQAIKYYGLEGDVSTVLTGI